MTENDTSQINLVKQKQQLLEQLLGSQETVKELGLQDILQIQEKFQDPLVLSVIVFKLIEERKKTNEILRDITQKYDELQFILKNKSSASQNTEEKYEILPETDDKIISYIRQKGKADAEEIQKALSYKGANAASQRLNNLVKGNYLRKIQAGRKVYFVVR